jgi:hypothetical protein
MLRLARTQVAGWKARLAADDLEVARDLVAAVEPLDALAREVARERRQLAARHAAALERHLARRPARAVGDDARDPGEISAILARLRKIAGV